jgi:hypothetical protein
MRRNNTLLQRIVTQQKLKAACYKHHRLTHHPDEPALLELFHVFISLVISGHGQLRFLG